MSKLLFDIGGTNMRMALGDGEEVSLIQKIPTPKDPETAIQELVSYADGKHIDAAAGGIAGVVHNGTVHSSTHLPGWHEFSFAEKLKAALHVPAKIRNDAEMAALGEAILGAGKDCALVGYICIGTGVGGAYVANGEIIPHTNGLEPGHQILDIEHGKTFEQLVSGSGLAEKYGKPPAELPRDVYAALSPTVATGLYNVILDWSPEVLVLGGSLMNEKNGFSIKDIEAALNKIPNAVPMPRLKHSEFGDSSGLYGALTLSPT